MSIIITDVKIRAENDNVVTIKPNTPTIQSTETAPLTSALSLNPHTYPHASPEVLNELLSHFAAYEKTYNEAFQISFSFNETNTHGILTQYFTYAMKNIRQKFDSYTFFSTTKFLSQTKAEERFQYIVIYNPNNLHYPLTLRIGTLNHARLGLGNAHYDKFHQIAIVKKIKMDLYNTSQIVKSNNSSTATEPTSNTTHRSLSAYNTYKDALIEHFIQGMPRVVLAGDIINRGGKIEITDQSGGFHFVEHANDSSSKIYDRSDCTAQIMKAIGFVGDVFIYSPTNPLDMSKDPRKLNKILHANSNGINLSANPMHEVKTRSEEMLIWSATGSAAAAAIRDSVSSSATNLHTDIFSAATNASALTIADDLH